MELIRKAQQIFEHAISLDLIHIEPYINDQCADNKELLNTVKSLLESHKSIPDDTRVCIETNIVKLLATQNEQGAEIKTIPLIQFKDDKYHLIKKINSGGMSSVYLCERDIDGFKQQVAIKILQGFENNPSFIERFTQEKHILAQLTHPNITQFIDTDQLLDGTPFVVMEYSPGLPITDYCKQNNFNINQRIKLFIKLCQAVQFAHQNLIIHRDIKPSNVLVTESNELKLLDFGIAKNLSYEKSKLTQTGHHVMTPAYASPEQLLKKPLNTLTDIYSLGMVLYELLTETMPFDLKKLSPGKYESLVIENIIEPPSKRSKQHVINGDLDAIVLKAMNSELSKRYPSVTEFIADLNRYLKHLPVAAQKPSLIYKTKKYIKRNSLIISTAISFMFISALFIGQIIKEKNYAEKERSKAKTISDSFILAFKNADPTRSLDTNVKAIHILDQVANIIQNNHSDNPILLAELSYTMAEVYFNMGSFEQALHIIEMNKKNPDLSNSKQLIDWDILKAKIEISTNRFDDALITVSKISPGHKEQNIETNLIKVNALAGKGKIEDAALIIDQLYEQIDSAHPLFSELCFTDFNLRHLNEEVKLQEIFLNQCIKNQSLTSIQDEIMKGKIYNKLAKSFQGKRMHDKSNEYYLKSLAIDKKIYGNNHISQVDEFKMLGWNVMQQMDFEKSIEYQNIALEISEKYFGNGHPNTTNAIFNLGHVYSNMEEYDKALELYNKAIDIMINNNLNEELKLAFYYKSIGHLQNDLGHYDDAEHNIKQSIHIFSLKQGGYIYRVAEMQVLLAHIFHNQGKDDKARTLIKEALPNMYTMHKEGDYYQELAENLDDKLNQNILSSKK